MTLQDLITDATAPKTKPCKVARILAALPEHDAAALRAALLSDVPATDLEMALHRNGTPASDTSILRWRKLYGAE